MEGLPMLGDALYGGSPAARVFLHAGELSFKHPSTEATVTFHAEPDFEAGREVALRRAIVDPDTNTFRVVHGAADGQQGWFVDRLGDCLLSSSEELLDDRRIALLTALTSCTTGRCAYHKTLRFRVGHANVGEASPRLVLGQPAPEFFSIRENGVQFYVSFREGYSAGLFLDQRDNRRRVLNGHVAAGFELAPDAPGGTREVLNTFAYTCGISVCAALARARVTSLDLSKKYLDWGRRNFVLNGLDPAAHDFIHGDCFEWMRRLAKKGRAFDLVLLDPPTFSRSKASGSFSAEKDYGKLVELALPLVKQGGVLFASTNAATLEPEEFLSTVRGAIAKAGRVVDAEHYAPQPPDFPITREEPGHLKTVWLRLT